MLRKQKKFEIWDYYVIPELEEFIEEICNISAQLKQKRNYLIKLFDQKISSQRWGKWRKAVGGSWPGPTGLMDSVRFKKNVLPEWSQIKSGMHYFARMSGFSLLLFTVGFFGMNAPAYSKIMMTWATQFGHVEVLNRLEPLGEKSDLIQGRQEPQAWLQVESPEKEQQIGISSVEVNPQAEKPIQTHLSILPPDGRLIIPRLNKNVPLISTDPQKLIGADWESLEKTFQNDLQNGVIHYPGTAEPGEVGNVFVTGHSSYYPWDPGRYKDVFALLHTLKTGDEIIIQFEEEEYHYVIQTMKKVKNNDVSVLDQNTNNEKWLTLMTCSPVGTNIQRLVVMAKQVN